MNPDTAAPSKLYEAAVGFLVSERSNTNAWEQVATFVSEYVNEHVPVNMKLLRREFAIVERQVKKDFEVNKLPASWRSAKSTALGALMQGIPLVDLAGAVQPKTDVGKLIKAAKKGTLARSDLEKLKGHLDRALDLFATLSPIDQVDAYAYAGAMYHTMEAAMLRPIGAATATAGS